MSTLYSPAVDDLMLNTPCSESPPNTLASIVPGPTPAAVIDDLLPASADAILLSMNQVSSPGIEDGPSLSLDAMIGADINPAPSHTVPRTNTILQTPRVNLRLPSFETLGLSATLIQRDMATQPGLLDTVHVLGTESDALDADSVDSLCSTRQSPVARRLVATNPAQHYVTTLTPPDDNGRHIWQSLAGSSMKDVQSTPDQTAQANGTPVQQPTPAADAMTSSQPRIKIHRTESDKVASTSWLAEASEVIVRNLEKARDLHGFIRVLSHALPCPSKKGFAYPIIINSLHDQTPGSPTCWINVFHALPGRFNLADLPTSPPATPGSPIGDDDYFTSKVFDSAIPILDYQDNITTSPKRAHPIVPPGTVHVSIVERYIPPSSKNEFAEMFDTKGRSLLVDRLIELSPDHGTLLFIYPTKRGAETFQKQYLGPVLDPLLRSMCVINSLSVELGSMLSTMSAIDAMHSYESLQERLVGLCNELGQQGSTLDQLQSVPAKYTLDYATKTSVTLERSVWAESWWVKQEKSRVRSAVSKYFRQARNLPADSELMPTSLIHEVLDGVAWRASSHAALPLSGIEVGIFVIKRTA